MTTTTTTVTDLVEEFVPTTSTRSQNIKWGESFALLQIMKTEGKNWGKLLQQLHNQHMFTHLKCPDDKDKIRAHYNTLKSKKSALWKNNLIPVYKLATGATPQQVLDG